MDQTLWIRTHDALPRNGETVLAYANGAYHVAMWASGIWMEGPSPLPQVSHWRPLPPAPHQEADAPDDVEKVVEKVLKRMSQG